MKLKAKLLLTTAGTVLLVLGISEWSSYRQTAAMLHTHEALMEQGMEHTALLKSFQNEKETLFEKLAYIHVFHGAAIVLVLTVVLSFLWNRLVLSRLRVLLCHINWMSRGTWKASVPVRHNDEIGELTRAFNQMGERLTATVRQEAAASKLAAMALLGQHMVKNVSVAHDHLRATTMMLRRVKERDEAVSDPILWNLEAVISTLERIPAQFEEDFDHQFREHTSKKTILRDRNPV